MQAAALGLIEVVNRPLGMTPCVAMSGQQPDGGETAAALQGILHRAMTTPDQPSLIEQISPKIAVARGWYCETSQQLLDAYKTLGCKDVVLKPVYGAAGDVRLLT